MDKLRASLFHCARTYIDLREHFDAPFEAAAAMPDADGTSFALFFTPMMINVFIMWFMIFFGL